MILPRESCDVCYQVVIRRQPRQGVSPEEGEWTENWAGDGILGHLSSATDTQGDEGKSDPLSGPQFPLM